MKKNKSNFNVVFCHLFELNFDHGQLLPTGRGEEEHENYFCQLKVVFP